MLVHLLFTALVSGIHSGNVTNSSGRGEARSLEEISVTKRNDELADLEGLSPNTKLNLTTEDDESFQDQGQLPARGHCYQELLEEHSHSLCGLEFHKSMEDIGAQHWCSFHKVIGPYNNLTFCMEQLSAILGCYYPNPSVQDFFLHTHAQFFLTCSEEELLLTDAPHNVVVVLTLVPVTIIPFLVYLVVWKSNRRE